MPPLIRRPSKCSSRVRNSGVSVFHRRLALEEGVRVVRQFEQFHALLDIAPVRGLVRLDIAHQWHLLVPELHRLAVKELVIDAAIELSMYSRARDRKADMEAG
jgi:hypothetical protein